MSGNFLQALAFMVTISYGGTTVVIPSNCSEEIKMPCTARIYKGLWSAFGAPWEPGVSVPSNYVLTSGCHQAPNGTWTNVLQISWVQGDDGSFPLLESYVINIGQQNTENPQDYYIELSVNNTVHRSPFHLALSYEVSGVLHPSSEYEITLYALPGSFNLQKRSAVITVDDCPPVSTAASTSTDSFTATTTKDTTTTIISSSSPSSSTTTSDSTSDSEELDTFEPNVSMSQVPPGGNKTITLALGVTVAVVLVAVILTGAVFYLHRRNSTDGLSIMRTEPNNVPPTPPENHNPITQIDVPEEQCHSSDSGYNDGNFGFSNDGYSRGRKSYDTNSFTSVDTLSTISGGVPFN